MQNLPSYLPFQLPFMTRGNQGGSGMPGPPGPPGHDPSRPTLSPPPIPDNLCELRRILLEIFHATNPSQHVNVKVKDILRDCTRHLEAECNKLANLTHLGHRAAEYSRDVLYLRMEFFVALDRRIEELSQLRSSFVESRDAFRAQPTKLLLEGIRETRGGFYDGMFSELRPHFEKIERYYYEINVSLRVEEEGLRRISSSLRVTPGDRLRWENIRDACGAASTLLTPGTQPLPNIMPQQTSNKAARYIRALAQTVTDARQSLLQTRQDIVGHPKSSLWRLRDVYENSQVACRQKIEEVHGFSEDFLQSFVEVPPLDDFHVYHLPSAASESSHILRQVHKQVQSTQYAVLYALPQLKGHFSSFERCLPIADASMQRLYATLPRLVLPLQQPDDRRQGVFRTMKPKELKAAYDEWREVERKWAAQFEPYRGHYTSSR